MSQKSLSNYSRILEIINKFKSPSKKDLFYYNFSHKIWQFFVCVLWNYIPIMVFSWKKFSKKTTIFIGVVLIWLFILELCIQSFYILFFITLRSYFRKKNNKTLAEKNVLKDWGEYFTASPKKILDSLLLEFEIEIEEFKIYDFNDKSLEIPYHLNSVFVRTRSDSSYKTNVIRNDMNWIHIKFKKGNEIFTDGLTTFFIMHDELLLKKLKDINSSIFHLSHYSKEQWKYFDKILEKITIEDYPTIHHVLNKWEERLEGLDIFYSVGYKPIFSSKYKEFEPKKLIVNHSRLNYILFGNYATEDGILYPCTLFNTKPNWDNNFSCFINPAYAPMTRESEELLLNMDKFLSWLKVCQDIDIEELLKPEIREEIQRERYYNG